MKHIRAISARPEKAQSASTGSILTVLAQVVTILGAFISQKEDANRIIDA